MSISDVDGCDQCLGHLYKDVEILYEVLTLAEPLLSIRFLYVLLVVLLSGWVLGAALRLSSQLAG